ncbi:MAG: LysR family transcriptional regulator [bacterium]|nr:LysR family transcriptional regulator [bacterium]
MIQIHRLEGFYWVARSGGYARAARAFPYPITQPAVHQQVKKLESELGVALFERIGKDQMAPTPAGKRLYEFVRPFFESLPGVVRSLREGDYGGELSIRTANMILRHLLPSWIKRLQKRHPRIQVHLQETVRPDLSALRQGEADLVVDYIPEIPDGIATMQVATVRPWIVMPRTHALASKKRISLNQFGDEPFISYSPGLLPRDLQLEALARHGATPSRTLTASTAEGILGFVESGLGFSILPSLDPTGPKSKGIQVAPLTSPKIEFPIVAAWRKDTPENPILDAALETAPKLA